MKRVKRKKIIFEIFEMKADAMLMATAICEQKKGFPKEWLFVLTNFGDKVNPQYDFV